MDAADYGLVGAFVGLAFGVVDYAFLNRFVYPRLRERHERAKVTRRHKLDPNYVMGLLKVVCFIGFPVAGYFLGLELARN